MSFFCFMPRKKDKWNWHWRKDIAICIAISWPKLFFASIFHVYSWVVVCRQNLIFVGLNQSTEDVEVALGIERSIHINLRYHRFDLMIMHETQLEKNAGDFFFKSWEVSIKLMIILVHKCYWLLLFIFGFSSINSKVTHKSEAFVKFLTSFDWKISYIFFGLFK